MRRDIQAGTNRITPVGKLASVEEFVVGEHFKVGVAVGGHKIAWMNDDFLHISHGVIERTVPARDVIRSTLTVDRENPRWRSQMPSLFDALGGNEAARFHFAHIFQMIDTGIQEYAFVRPRKGIGWDYWLMGWNLSVAGWMISAGPFSRMMRPISYVPESFEILTGST